ncbi:hypothetical protein HBHAL_4411 [Halobacillus halophilus DSM 2266]|uniref:Uncharacterized protein n=1 Tax=Halobacillus halophilus (strain ATCC 35676 / DSM 2266 / JCM 20832 / KCTC 3685 / LMG 17431 / NBRC 102448 / NCIMB 2269) TaxID=866895 RepID=I0JRI0_HALH3|nr:hypothetical protein HBHAL_4411 [Halobacillus halophilus DSM 2266]
MIDHFCLSNPYKLSGFICMTPAILLSFLPPLSSLATPHHRHKYKGSYGI